ncbi:MAG TPA: hypothetical protein VGK25_06640 [Ignavibacteria bacterium]
MKYAITVFFFILFFTLLAYSQPYGWFPLNSGTTNNLNNVYFSDANSSIVVGQSDIILPPINSKSTGMRELFKRGIRNELSRHKGIKETKKDGSVKKIKNFNCFSKKGEGK